MDEKEWMNDPALSMHMKLSGVILIWMKSELCAPDIV